MGEGHRTAKFLTLDGPEPGKGGRVPRSDLEDVPSPVQAGRGLHSDAVFEVWVWEGSRYRFVVKESTDFDLQGPLAGS